MTSDVDQLLLSAVNQRADWRRVRHIYDQCLKALEGPLPEKLSQPYLPPLLTGLLAEVLARVSASYHGSGMEEALIKDAFSVFASRDDRPTSSDNFIWLYRDTRFLRLPIYAGTIRGQRRRPTPFEATVETARRLRDLQAIEDVLEEHSAGAILGGSVSYGRFFNVVGHNQQKEGSDADLLIVLDDYNGLASMCQALLGRKPAGISRDALERVADRAESFLSITESSRYNPAMFSARIPVWTSETDPVFAGVPLSGSYNIEFHVVSRNLFELLTLRYMPQISRDAESSRSRMWDFRETPPSRSHYQRCFTGEGRTGIVKSDAGIGGSVPRENDIFYIDDDDRYFPGPYQNLILPLFDVRWGDSQTRRTVESFRWKMIERLRYEKVRRPNDVLRLSLAHTRSEVFAPHIIRSVDRGMLVA